MFYVRFASLNHYVFSTLPNSSVIFSAFAYLFIKNILLIYHHFTVQLTINTSDRDGTPVRRAGAPVRLPLVRLDGTIGSGALLCNVCLVVFGQMRLLPEALATQRARKGLLTRVRPHMHVH